MNAAPAVVAPRRSARIAAKPKLSYEEPAVVLDSELKKRTKDMFDTLMDEIMEATTRNFSGVIGRTRREFVKMFADLPKDNEERVAAETFSKIVWESDTYIKYDNYVRAYVQKNLKTKAAMKAAKRKMRAEEDAMLSKLYKDVLADAATKKSAKTPV
jgi:hypothetical protein